MNGLTQSLQSFIWEVYVDWLGTVTSVDYLGGMALTGLTQSLQSFIWGVWKLTGLTQSLQSCIWGGGGMGVNWLDTVNPVVYRWGGWVGMGLEWLDTVTSVVYLGCMR